MATIHAECFNVFVHKCQIENKLERLALSTAWREPWRAAPSLGLRPRLAIKKAMHLAADLCNMPILRSLPDEIGELIRSLSESAPFWRYASVMDLVDRVSTTNDEESGTLTSHRVSDICSWNRGLPPVISCSSHPVPGNTLFRITIDSSGINSIEKLQQDLPSSSTGRSDTFAYIVENKTALRGVMVDFQVCKQPE